MQQLRKAGDQQDEAQRFTASQAARECSQLDERSVLFAALAKREAGLEDEAREIVRQYRAQKGGK
jgi:hypothetical protein